MLFIGGALVSSAPTKQVCTNKASMHQQSKYAPTQPHTPHGLKPHKRRQSAAAPVYANVRIINE